MYENNPETFVSRNTIGSNQITKWTYANLENVLIIVR